MKNLSTTGRLEYNMLLRVKAVARISLRGPCRRAKQAARIIPFATAGVSGCAPSGSRFQARGPVGGKKEYPEMKSLILF